jgi:prolyl-tRNA synthetase
LDIIREAKLADYSAVKGCMIIRPNGYAIWENIQRILDGMFKDTGHVNAYFPLFIPKSFFEKEAKHAKGFAKECAVVTHHRLKDVGTDTEPALVVDPDAKLPEELIVRPTSETIIWSAYKQWVQSWRDLPILINQWANVVRWEMRTRLFLRTAEFLWQEGHTAHRTFEDAEAEAVRMLEVYRTFAEEYMAMPVFAGKKTEGQKFAGALHTYTIEAMMQDKKALQAGTSHNLGQGFAESFDVKFRDQDGTEKFVWATSWGVSTRLIGALIMCHSDDKGLVLPPRLAPVQVTIIPIWKSQEERRAVISYADKIITRFRDQSIRVKIDAREEYQPGWKFTEWELEGVPLRLEIGPRDMAKEQVVSVRRDTGEKSFLPLEGLEGVIKSTLQNIQKSLFERAKAYRDANTVCLKTLAEVQEFIEGDGGFARVFWNGGKTEEEHLATFNATIRCVLPNREDTNTGKCIVTGVDTSNQVIIAKAY